MGCTLHDHGHGHSHGQSNDIEVAHPTENINVRAAFIHVVSDFVQSCGVFIAALVIFFKPEWSIIDPICTFLFSFLVLFTTINIMKDALLVCISFYNGILILFEIKDKLDSTCIRVHRVL